MSARRREQRPLGARLAEESGLVKTILVSIILLAAISVAGIDTVSILVAKYRVDDTADAASFEAAGVYKTAHDAGRACDAARQLVAERDQEAVVPQKKGCSVAPDGSVTVTVHETANTFLAKRLGFFEPYTHAVGRSTSPPPP